MALEIGAGITLGGGISLTVEGGAGGGGNELATGTITVGNQIDRYGWSAGQFGDSTFSIMGPVVAIIYDSAFPRTEVRFLTGTYGSVVIDFDTVDGETSITAVVDGITETLTMNGSGIAIIANDPFDLANKVGQTLNVSITPGVVDSGGGGATTYTNSSTTFLGNGDGPPWVISSLYNGGTSFKVATASTPSSEFISALNALTTGSVITVVDANEGPITVTLTSGFDGTFTTSGNENYTASCTSPATQGYNITSITI